MFFIMKFNYLFNLKLTFQQFLGIDLFSQTNFKRWAGSSAVRDLKYE